MRNSHIHRWFGAVIALLLLIMPVLLADEFSLFANWLLLFFCWMIVIVIGLILVPSSRSNNSKAEGSNP